MLIAKTIRTRAMQPATTAMSLCSLLTCAPPSSSRLLEDRGECREGTEIGTGTIPISGAGVASRPLVGHHLVPGGHVIFALAGVFVLLLRQRRDELLGHIIVLVLGPVFGDLD